MLHTKEKPYSLSGSWVWIKNLLSLVPTKADIKVVQLDLLGVAVVFFSFVSCLQIRFSLYIFIDQLASMLAWTFFFWGGSDPIKTQVCLRTERPVKQTNNQSDPFDYPLKLLLPFSYYDIHRYRPTCILTSIYKWGAVHKIFQGLMQMKNFAIFCLFVFPFLFFSFSFFLFFFFFFFFLSFFSFLFF